MKLPVICAVVVLTAIILLLLYTAYQYYHTRYRDHVIIVIIGSLPTGVLFVFDIWPSRRSTFTDCAMFSQV